MTDLVDFEIQELESGLTDLEWTIADAEQWNHGYPRVLRALGRLDMLIPGDTRLAVARERLKTLIVQRQEVEAQQKAGTTPPRNSPAITVVELSEDQRQTLEKDGWQYNPRSGSYTRYTAADSPSLLPAIKAALSVPAARTLRWARVSRAPRSPRRRRAASSVAGSRGSPARPGDDEPPPRRCSHLTRLLCALARSLRGRL